MRQFCSLITLKNKRQILSACFVSFNKIQARNNGGVAIKIPNKVLNSVLLSAAKYPQIQGKSLEFKIFLGFYLWGFGLAGGSLRVAGRLGFVLFVFGNLGFGVLQMRRACDISC